MYEYYRYTNAAKKKPHLIKDVSSIVNALKGGIGENNDKDLAVK